MLKDITLGQFYKVDSPVHRLDPRVKIIFAIGYVVGMFVASSLAGYLAVVGLLIAVIFLSRVPMMKILAGIKPLWFILLFTFVINLFFSGTGETLLFKWQFVSIYRESLVRAAVLSFRLVLLVAGTSMLTLTTSPLQLTDGIESLLSPLRVIGFPAHEIAMMMTIALRFIPTLIEETDKIMKAQTARGADFASGGLMARAKGIIPLLVPLFISAFRRADDLTMAMEARCYRGGKGRTRMKVLRMGSRDVLALAVLTVFLAAVFVDGYYLAALQGWWQL